MNHPHGEQPEDDLDPTLEDDLAEALADVDITSVDPDGEQEDPKPSEEAESHEPKEPSLEEQLRERTEDLQRINAEYANFRRRTAQERAGIIEQAKAQVLTELLPLLDDFDLAEQHGDLKEGPLKAFRDKFVSITRTLKVEAFGFEGDPFDAECHEAVQDLSEGEDKRLGTILRKGYKMNERLLRTAMVIITDPQPEAGTNEGEPVAE
ncbi:nucleotide exchange factor GrpE [Corynebacterium sp. ES2775-CONJ]|uniref:nucleotide exchange factor GrpE n=1 Tax=Corynebacterium sp. ES2775-CONJ TaxID=2974029 RepID=UPI00216996BB|nr:nucleotide exchange factor GrpE [Corynebacterium sp. ES2775-CONJ]MCS4490173.1 nucleotide exchange factor GrpE [Corynebacterium sp. ES2775-CONJ]